MNNNIEFIGILAMLFILVSFCFNKEKDIRVINILGASLFIYYGILKNNISVYLLNIILVLIHLYKLYLIEGQE